MMIAKRSTHKKSRTASRAAVHGDDVVVVDTLLVLMLIAGALSPSSLVLLLDLLSAEQQQHLAQLCRDTSTTAYVEAALWCWRPE